MAVILLPRAGDIVSHVGAEPPPALRETLVDADVPLVLLPVRLETRFFALADGGQELRIRVFPDQVHIDAHERDLSRDEHTWGVHYWDQTWRAGNDEAAQRRAWQQLADRFDAPRAAWIARALAPTNPGDRPAAPVAADATLALPPRLAAARVRDDADIGWRSAPVARLMPQRWIAIAKARGAIVGHASGAPVTPPPQVGPDPDDPSADDAPDDDVAVDAGMRWLVDFDEAERAGMAMRMPLPAGVAQSGVDVLTVFGVAEHDDGASASAALADLLDAHRHTDGLECLEVGTPTNNTAEAPSGYSTHDPLHVRSFEDQRRGASWQRNDGSHADALAQALGFDDTLAASALAPLREAASREPLHARHMATALWPATWGYYLANGIDVRSTPLTHDDIAWARRFFIDHVRAYGPLPTLRVGRQPYGVLPVTSLADWRGTGADASRGAWLAQWLSTLRDRLWRPRLPDVPRVGRSNDPGQDLRAVLSSDAVANAWRVRHLLGPRYVQHLRTFLGDDLAASGWLAAQQPLATGVLRAIGAAWTPRLATATFDEAIAPLRGALVQPASDPPSPTLAPDYIAALLSQPPLPPTDGVALPPADPPTLLHLLLRHSLHLETVAAAARLAARAGMADAAGVLRDAELVNLGDATATATWRTLLGRSLPATGSETIAQWLGALRRPADFESDDLAPLGQLRAALEHLRTLPVATLERLLAGTLDVASHRLDAWVASFATQRLAEMRQVRPHGVRIGGYGWVMNLKPQLPADAVQTPAGETAPVHARPDDSGFIHAPSVSQAQAAALLRNAHLSHSRGDARDLFAVDLSSRRVRIASWLLDGVREGQPLGALLGYRFERSLHDAGLDALVDDFRAIAPLVPATPGEPSPPGGASAEAVAAQNVVDGLRLHELASSRAAEPLFAQAASALASLAEAVDAVGDAVIAEAAFQAVRGNTARTAATLQAVASGELPPPELEVVRTPRSGVAVTHRLVMLPPVEGDAAADAGLQGSADTPRARAEPRLNAWAARLLGAPAHSLLTVERRDATAAVVERHPLSLADLALAPLDVVYLAGRPGEPMTLLETLVLRHVRRALAPMAPGETLVLDRARQPAWSPRDLGIAELAEVAGRARDLLAHARALDARDLVAPGSSADSGVDAPEIERRAQAAVAALTLAEKALRERPLPGGAADDAALDEAVAAAVRFGAMGALPSLQSESAAAAETHTERLDAAGAITTTASDGAPLAVRGVARELQRRLEAAAAVKPAPAGADAAQRAAAAAARLHAVFGDDFRALPRVSRQALADLPASLAASTALQGGDALAAYTWLARAQRVREGVSRLSASLHAAEALSGEASLLRVAQLPHSPGDRWVGLPATAARPLAAGRVSVVVQGPLPADADEPLCGLLVDEWVEVVPSATETTAIAFQHDAPDTRAPQAILVAVPPVPGEAWTPWSLHRTLLDTLDLAMLRAIDAEALDTAALDPVTGAADVAEVAHFLPALLFAVNVDGDAVSPDFGPLTR